MKSRYNRLFAGFALLGAAVCATAWGAEVGDANAAASVAGASQTITGTQVWKASASPRLVHGVVTVSEGATLTIEAGADVQFDADLSAGIHVLGKLNVAGTLERPVTLHGAVADKDARWRGIWTETKTASITMSNARLSGAVTGVEDRGGSVRLSSTEISGSIRAVLAGGKTASMTVEDAKLSNNTFGIDAFDGATVSATGTHFLNNRTAVSVNRTGLYLSSNEFSGNRQGILTDDAGLVKGSSNRLATDGKLVGVEVAALVTRPAVATVSGSINADTTWTVAQSPILVSSSLHVASDATLTIQPGVVVRFAAGADSGLIVDGRLLAVGTREKPIYFTSALDRGTGFTLAPSGFESGSASAGDWSGIRLNGSTGKSVLQHVTVRYSRTGVTVHGQAPVASLDNSFRDDVVGLAVTGDSSSVNSYADSFVGNATGMQLNAGTTAISSAAFSYDVVAIAGAPGASASVSSSSTLTGTVATQVAKQAGFNLTLNGANALRTASALLASSAAPASVRIGLDAPACTPVNMPSFSTVPTGWVVPQNRLAPAGFTATTNQFGRANSELQISISIDQATSAGNDLGAYQGNQYTPSCNINVAVSDLYIPSAWRSASTGGPVATYMWATGDLGDYSVIGFRNYSTGSGTFTVWNDNLGAFVDLPAVGINYNGWNNLSMVYSGASPNAIVYYINGVQVNTTALYNNSTKISSVFMNAVNFFGNTNYSSNYSSYRAAAYTTTWSDTVAPQILTTALPTQLSGLGFSTNLTATEGAPPYTWSFGSGGNFAGSGLGIVGNVLSGTPVAGSYSIPVKVTDAQGTAVTQFVTWLVGNQITISVGTPPGGAVGKAYSGFLFSGTGGVSALQYTVSSGSLPPGLTLSPSGGLSGTPTTAGAYSFTVRAADGSLNPATASVNITIYAAPVVTTGSLATGKTSSPYSAGNTATGGSGTFVWSATGLPGGLGINPSSGTISGTPTNAGVFSPVITITDSAAGTTASATLALNVYNTLSITTSSLAAGAVTKQYAGATLAVAGGSGSVTWSQSGLPSGLTFDTSKGVIGGTPTAPFASNVTFTATDTAAGQSASTSLSLTIYAGISFGGTGGGAVNLTGALLGKAYSASTPTPAGGSGNFTFSATGVPAGLTIDPNSGVISGTPTAAGVFSITVTVTDPTAGVTGQVSLNLTVNSLTITTSSLPSGLLSVGYPGATLSATGGSGTYTWTAVGLPAGLSFNNATGQISGTPTVSGTFLPVFTATDTTITGLTATTTLSITIQGAITVTTSSLPSGVKNQVYPGVTMAATGGTGTFVWSASGLPAGLGIDRASGAISGTPTVAGSFSAAITATDAGNAAATTVATLKLSIIDTLSVTTTSLPSSLVNQTYTGATLTASGGSGNFAWTATGLPAGLTLTGNQIAGKATADGTYSVKVTVTDTTLPTLTATATLSLTIFKTVAISATTLTSGVAGQLYAGATVVATGGSGTYTWTATGLPDGMTMNSLTGQIRGTPTTAGTYSAIVVTATDPTAGTSNSITLSLTVLGSLSITAPSLPVGVTSQAYTGSLTATGGSGSYVWFATGLPAGLSLNPSTGQITGTPTTAGSTSATVTVNDPTFKLTASTTINITVNAPPLTLSAPSGFAPLIAQGAPVSGAFLASGGTSPYSYSAALPAGMSIGAGNGQLSGTPGAPGVYSITVQVTDAASKSATATVSFGVLGFTTSSIPSGTAGTAYSATLTAAGGTGLTFSGSPVNGLTIQGSGSISGSPTAAGNFTLNATVSSGGVSTSASFAFTIAAAPIPLSVTGATLPKGQVGTSYSSAVNAAGGKSPYTFIVTGGDLPAGLQLNPSTGQISGVPTAVASAAVTIQATDSLQAIASGSFTLAVSPATLTAGGSFPQGVVGVGYPTQQPSISGGVAPYTITLTGGNLPGGLSLNNGAISGTPSSAKTFTFELTITDGNQTAVKVPESITIISNTAANLILSQNSLTFQLNSGATVATLPSANSVGIGSSVPLQILNYQVSGGDTWLTVTPAAATTVTTPGNPVGAVLNEKALSLKPGTYSATIAVACVAPSPCANTSQNIGVTLTVAAPPAVLATTTPVVSFSTIQSVAPPGQSILIQNAGGGSITGISVSQADNWYTVGAPPSTPLASGATGLSLPVTVNPNNGLSPGYYTSTVSISSSAGTVTVQVTLQISQNLLSLSQTGQQFSMTAGSPAPAGLPLNVGALASTSWSATAQSTNGWLSISGAGSGTAGPGAPGTLNFSVNSLASGLGAGTYFGSIIVSASGVSNSPLYFVVTLVVTPQAAPLVATPSPSSLLFFTTKGSDPTSQTVSVSVNSANSVNYQASPTNSTSWISVSPQTGGTASSTAPGISTISINAANLVVSNTLYQGQVGYQAGGTSQAVNVYLLLLPVGTLLPPGYSAHLRAGESQPNATTSAVTCVPTKLFVAQTGLVTNFQQTTGLPAPLSALVFNDCGVFVSNASITVTFSNGDAPVTLSAAAQSSASGTYSATWTPLNPSPQVSAIFNASAPGIASASTIVGGQVISSGLPSLTKNSTTNVYQAVLGSGIAPGTIVMLYGTNLAPSATSASTTPLPTSLAGTSVTIGGIPAPLYYVSPTQINAQVPAGLLPGNQYQVVINVAGGAATAPDLIQVTTAAPGIAETGSGVAIAQHSATYTLITQANPAKPGEYVTLYLSGLGATSPAVAAGAVSPTSPLALVSTVPRLTLNGTPVPVSFAGLTPTLVGLYQINFQVPANTPNGDLQLVVTQGTSSSNAVILPVHN